MKMPRLFRPMMVIGSGVIALVVYFFLMVPNATSSLLGLLLLMIAGAIGVTAVVVDMRKLAEEIKHLKDTNQDQ